MKRDMDLCRELLIAVEKIENPNIWNPIRSEGRSSAEVNEHLYLLEQAGLIEAVDLSDLVNGIQIQPIRLTWAGHEFLDSARSNKVWEGAKALVIKATGTLSIEGLKLAMPTVMKSLMGG